MVKFEGECCIVVIYGNFEWFVIIRLKEKVLFMRIVFFLICFLGFLIMFYLLYVEFEFGSIGFVGVVVFWVWILSVCFKNM